jgi:D-methionine transport system substrate-binding protein
MNKKFLMTLGFCMGSIPIFVGQSSGATLTVGVTAGPHAIIMEQVKKEVGKADIQLKIVEFNDFILPNAALNQGDLDLNCYQHQPFLDDQVQSRGYKIKSVAKTIVLPLGAYSHRHLNMSTLSEKAKIAVPNDPTNGGRALLLLQKNGLLELKSVPNPSVLDIVKNPKKFQIIELEAPQLPRSLADVDLAVINTDWVLLAGLDPKKALFTEDKDSPYANVIAVKIKDEQKPEIKKVISVYQSKIIRDFILKHYSGAILPAWDH